VTGWDRLPIDPDVDAVEDARHHPGRPPERGPRTRWPTLSPAVLGYVFAGGCLGGVVRYAVTDRWPASAHGFPWSTLAVNLAGAFVLGVVVVVAADLPRSPSYLRPLLGTGFCGALTTFSSIVVSADELVARGSVATAVAYLVVTIGAGLAVAAFGVVVGRRIAG